MFKYLLRCVAQRGDGWDLLAGTLARCGVVGSTFMARRGKQNDAHTHSGSQGIGVVFARYIGLGVKPRIHDHCSRCDEASSSAFRPRFLNFDVFLSSHRTTLDLHVATSEPFWALQTDAKSAAAPFFPMEHWVRQAKALGPISNLQTVAELPGGDQV